MAIPATASCGTVTWTEQLTVTDLNNFVQNPFVAFENLNCWTINSVTLDTHVQNPPNSGITTHQLTYDNTLGVYLYETSGGTPANQEYNYWYATSGNLINTVTITASYCPYDPPSTIPTLYLGSICDISGIVNSMPILI